MFAVHDMSFLGGARNSHGKHEKIGEGSGANVHTQVTARRHEIEKNRVRGNGILASHALSSHALSSYGRDRGSVRRSFAYERDHRGAAKPDEKQQVQAKLHQRPGWRSSWVQSQ